VICIAEKRVSSEAQLILKYSYYLERNGLLCGLVVRVPGYRSRGPGSIPGTTKFSEK
jgi:hypothetical protein